MSFLLWVSHYWQRRLKKSPPAKMSRGEEVNDLNEDKKWGKTHKTAATYYLLMTIWKSKKNGENRRRRGTRERSECLLCCGMKQKKSQTQRQSKAKHQSEALHGTAVAAERSNCASCICWRHAPSFFVEKPNNNISSRKSSGFLMADKRWKF